METPTKRKRRSILALLAGCASIPILGFTALLIIYSLLKPPPVDLHVDLGSPSTAASVSRAMEQIKEITGVHIPEGATVEVDLHADYMGFDERAWWLKLEGDHSVIQHIAKANSAVITEATGRNLQHSFIEGGSIWYNPAPDWWTPEDIVSVEVAYLRSQRYDWIAIYGETHYGTWALIARGFTWPIRHQGETP